MNARALIALPLAALITVGLFLTMSYLIATGEKALQDTGKSVSIDFVRVPRDETPQLKERELPDKQQAVEPPPPPPPSAANTAIDPNAMNIGVNMPKLDANIRMQGGMNLGAAPSDGDILPLVTVQPQYPDRALSRGIEGWVLVELTVTPEGTVVEPRVLSADPAGYFENATLRAVSRFRYKPKVVNGTPVPQTGVQYKMTFKIAK
jgi:protein TonB